jgi:stage V sporulation protein AB
MWINQIILGVIGLGGGLVVAGGAIALIIGLGIIPRFSGVTHTAHRVLLYEDCVLLGAVVGNIIFMYQLSIPFGGVMMMIFGIFAGIFLGSWIIALAEVVNAFPILSRRIKLTKGIPLVIICISLGKLIGSLLHFSNRW